MNDCCNNSGNHNDAEFSRIINVPEGFWYSFYIDYCSHCGTVINSRAEINETPETPEIPIETSDT